MKENDYLVAKINNPTFGAVQFRQLGLNPNNTQLLSNEKYILTMKYSIGSIYY